MKVFAMLLLGMAAYVQAANAAEPLVASLDARRVVVEVNGTERLLPADVARPNDVVEYRTTYSNVSKKTLTAVAATLPVPAGFQFIAGTATRGALASLDGKTYAPIPLTRVVKDASGRDQVVAVPVAEYRFLRWNLGDVPAAASRVVVARMRMDDSAVVVAR